MAPGPANLWWCGFCGTRASKPVVVWVLWYQSQQTCAGAYKRSLQFVTIWKVDAKLVLQVAYQTMRQLACLLIDLNLPSPTYHPTQSTGSTFLPTWKSTGPPSLSSGYLQVLPFYQPGKEKLRSLVAPKGAGGYKNFRATHISTHLNIHIHWQISRTLAPAQGPTPRPARFSTINTYI